MILFIEMIEVAGLLPNITTMASVMPACVQCEAFSSKESIHGYAVKLGYEGTGMSRMRLWTCTQGRGRLIF